MEIIRKTKEKDEYFHTLKLKKSYRRKGISRLEFIRKAAMAGVIMGGIGAFLVGDARQAAAADDPVRGGTLRTEYNWIPYVEDPAADGVGTGYVGLAIAESLIWVGEDGVPQPQLIKSWEASDDTTEVEPGHRIVAGGRSRLPVGRWHREGG
jgi:hypothetical protein